MDEITKEISDILNRSRTLKHIGTPKHSGRYPWGSGDNPYQRTGDFLSRIKEYEKQGYSEKKIAELMNTTTGKLRIQKSIANDQRKALERETARAMRDDGLSYQKIAEKMGYQNDSSIRNLLNDNSVAKARRAQLVANHLKKMIDEEGVMIDVGSGAERYLDCSKDLLKKSLYMLQLQGYELYGGGIPTGPNKQTNQKVICPPGTEEKEIYNYENIKSLSDYQFKEGSDSPDTFKYPKSMDSARIYTRYAEDGGKDNDGLIEIRRGVEDLSLGKSHYAQVRILVDDNHYAKGMAIYSDDIPEGYDMVYNTNKPVGTAKEKVFKPKDDKDPNNPFGSLIKKEGQSEYIDKDGNKQLSLINKRAEEGDWDDWADNLPAQFLSKQPKKMIKEQLGLSIEDRQKEYDEICAITNPTVKKALLASFANDCDSSAVHLEAAALPRQKYKVILPVNSLKDTEVYAPTYENGEQLALVRFPHGGTFEIPIVTVNNKHPKAKQLLDNAKDAIGINSKVAERLSGADFDGDTVLTIPTGRNSKTQVLSTKIPDGLEGFNPKDEYGECPGMTYMKRETKGKNGSKKIIDNTQKEMGKISNLITDMTLRGAPDSDIVMAVRHSMVVIDAAKHKLDYKKSEVDNQIKRLKKEYQGREEEGRYKQGAATLISRASSETSIPKRVGSPKVNQKGKPWYDDSKPEGALVYKELTDDYVDKNGKKHSASYKVIKKVVDPDTGEVTKIDTGKTKKRLQKSTQMEDTDDAYTLSSGTPQEELYANYANKMKSMANEARKEMVYTGKIKFSSASKLTYQDEVNRLDAALNLSERNKPRERDAQRIKNTNIKIIKEQNPDMSKDEIKKREQQELTKARTKVGAQRTPIQISDREWEAIQAGAVSEEKLKKILDNADLDKIRARATPRSYTELSASKISKISSMRASGYNIAEIARAIGASATTVSNYLN